MAVEKVVAERNSLAVHFGLQDSKTVAMCPHGVHMVSTWCQCLSTCEVQTYPLVN